MNKLQGKELKKSVETVRNHECEMCWEKDKHNKKWPTAQLWKVLWGMEN